MIDLGNGVKKNIASGLRKFIPIDQMQDAMVVVAFNLRPRKMLKGAFESHGMVMCAEQDESKSAVELLVPPEGS